MLSCRLASASAGTSARGGALVSFGSSRSLILSLAGALCCVCPTVRGRDFGLSRARNRLTGAQTDATSNNAKSLIVFRFISANLLTSNRAALIRLTPAAPEQNRLHRLEQDHCVEHQALVLDVVEIVLQFLPRVFDGRAVWIFDLR